MSLINCPECNNQISDNSAFCIKCGYMMPILKEYLCGGSFQFYDGADYDNNKLTKAQCTNCNATLEVDASLKTAICPFCNTTYIVEEAINNYNFNIESNNMHITNATITMSGMDGNIENLIKRARQFEAEGNSTYAYEYYEKVLDIDADNKIANTRKKKILEKTHFFSEEITAGLWGKAKIVLRYGRIDYVPLNGKVRNYYFENMREVEYTESEFGFKYGETIVEWKLNGAELLAKLYDDAIKGIYHV